MKFTDFILAIVVVALGLFFVVLMFGILMPGEPEIPGELFSDNWFHIAHPRLAIACAAILALILIPKKKRTEKQA